MHLIVYHYTLGDNFLPWNLIYILLFLKNMLSTGIKKILKNLKSITTFSNDIKKYNVKQLSKTLCASMKYDNVLVIIIITNIILLHITCV